MPKIIRLGDPTSHGGKVTQVSGGQEIHGLPVARKGDLVSCPKEGHGVNPIIEGCEHWLIEDIPVAVEGNKTACGCTLLSTLGADVGVML